MTYEELKKAYEEATKKCSELEKENSELKKSNEDKDLRMLSSETPRIFAASASWLLFIKIILSALSQLIDFSAVVWYNG